MSREQVGLEKEKGRVRDKLIASPIVYSALNFRRDDNRSVSLSKDSFLAEVVSFHMYL